MKDRKDILLDQLDELIIRNGDFPVGESLNQDVSIILRLNQGDLKSDPLLGPNLIRLLKSNVDRGELQTRIKLHFERDGIDYENFKNRITIKRQVK